MAELTPAQKRKQTMELKKRQETVVSKYGEFVDVLPKDLGWFDTRESAVELVKTMHVDIMGKDKQGNARPFNDLKYFLFQAAQRKLNPFKQQIHALYIWDSSIKSEKLVVVTGIGGFRKIAQKSERPLYAGVSEPVWTFKEDEEGGQPIKATVQVFAYNPVTGDREAIATGVAWWDEYVKLVDEYGSDRQKTGRKVPNTTWATKGKLMLAKCAEAMALRQAFPDELGGLYEPAEIDHLHTQPSDEEIEEGEQAKRDAIKEELEKRRKAGTVFEGEVVDNKPEGDNSSNG